MLRLETYLATGALFPSFIDMWLEGPNRQI